MATVKELIAPIYTNEILLKQGIVEKAVKLLLKYIEAKDDFISLAAARHNFKNITSQQAFICAAELESMGFLVGKQDKNRFMYKFNSNGEEKTSISIPVSKIDAAQKKFEEKIANKVARAAKTIERYKNLASVAEFVQVVQQEQQSLNDPVIDKDFISKQKPKSEVYLGTPVHTKSAKELHDSQECDNSTCRFCAIEQDKAIGF